MSRGGRGGSWYPGHSDRVLAGVVCGLPGSPFSVVHRAKDGAVFFERRLEGVEHRDGAKIARGAELLEGPVLEHHTILEGDALVEADVPHLRDGPTWRACSTCVT